ncbi:MAG: Fis family transcriptional regulator [Aphanothece sp. CMT-3BRIN-NPC111]|jgi:anti-sigma factor RsiW|nr:Fis family transcriptional regulator [Aphanothece sp. CMT-3BRIN-NPC111]
MTLNFDPRKDSRQQDTREMDSLQRTRFELVSAYLDGEVTAAERKQVQQWLATDPEVKQQYAKLVKLRQGIQTLPVPQAEQSPKQIAQQVLARLDRYRSRQIFAWGGAALAAVVIGALSGVVPGSESQTAQIDQSTQPEATHEPLMVALNRPVVEIPKAAVAAPEKSLTSPYKSIDTDKTQN